ncbi:MAG: M10 family metallopeptidase C-terminal domain-containing protein, partial [Hyphomicrobium sp.]
MVTIAEAAANIGRTDDPQGEGYGIHANVSISFWGGAGAFTPEQRAATLRALQAWSDVAQLNFFTDNDDPEIAFRNYFNANSTELGRAVGPSHTTSNGFTVFTLNPDTTVRVGLNLERTNGNNLGLGRADYNTLLHEIGHAVGLNHPDEIPGYDGVNNRHSLMFSDKAPGAFFARTPLLHDIAAAQRLYGANMTTRTSDTTYGFNSNAGDAYLLRSDEDRAVFCIWDADGNDTLNASGYAVDQTINLAPGTFSSVGGMRDNISMADAVDFRGNNSWEAGFTPNRISNLIENAIGGSARDVINGNQAYNRLEGRDGNDELFGHAGNDSLYGGNGNDHLNGGTESDFLNGGESNDHLVGYTGIDYLYGDAGDDTL